MWRRRAQLAWLLSIATRRDLAGGSGRWSQRRNRKQAAGAGRYGSAAGPSSPSPHLRQDHVRAKLAMFCPSIRRIGGPIAYRPSPARHQRPRQGRLRSHLHQRLSEATGGNPSRFASAALIWRWLSATPRHRFGAVPRRRFHTRRWRSGPPRSVDGGWCCASSMALGELEAGHWSRYASSSDWITRIASESASRWQRQLLAQHQLTGGTAEFIHSGRSWRNAETCQARASRAQW